MRSVCRFTVLGALGLLAIAGVPHRVSAQQRPDVVRGVVRSGGVRIPYAVVEFGALRGKLINILVTDETTAREILGRTS